MTSRFIIRALVVVAMVVLAGCDEDQSTTASAPSTTAASTDPAAPAPTDAEPTPSTEPPQPSQSEPEPPTATPPEPEQTIQAPTTTQPAPEPIEGQPCTFPEVVDPTLGALVADCEALWNLYSLLDARQQLESDPATAWHETNPLRNWKGVTVADGRVTELRLDKMDLSGELPESLEFPTSLKYLDLSHNEFTHVIPADIANLTSLAYLDLSRNQLIGSIPAALGNLTNLQHLNLRGNELIGSIPVELANLTNLQHLDLSHNRLHGPLPPELANVPDLAHSYFESSPCTLPTVVDQTLELLVADCEALWSFFESQDSVLSIGEDTSSRWGSANPLESWDWVEVTDGRVTGFRISPFPSLDVTLTADLGSLTAIEHLSGCHVHGQLPPELGNLANLKTIDIQSYSIGAFNACVNFLTGPIPPEFGNLANLEALNISDNDLTGPLPSELGNLTNLKELRLANNAGLSGPIPREFGNLTSLTELELSCNSLTGSIPAELGNLTNLTLLGLGYNDLTGPVPLDLLNLANLERLVLYANEQLGPIPDDLLQIAEDFSHFDDITADSRQEVLTHGWDYYRYRYWGCPS